MSQITELLTNSEAMRRSVFLPAPMRGQMEAQIEQLKHRLLGPMVARVGNAELARELSWAANEAAALAWFTACPMLVLPTLLEEKVQDALRRWGKQEELWQR